LALALAKKAATLPAKKRELANNISRYRKTGMLPSGRAYKRAQRKIEDYRRRLFEQYGGEDRCRPDVAICCENAVTSAAISLLCQVYLKKSGIFRQDSLKRGDLELMSVLQKGYTTFSALATRQLEAAARLATMKTAPDDGPSDLDKYLSLKAKETPGGTVYEAQERAQDAQEGQGQGDGDGNR
jgi:hypothetical protein